MLVVAFVCMCRPLPLSLLYPRSQPLMCVCCHTRSLSAQSARLVDHEPEEELVLHAREQVLDEPRILVLVEVAGDLGVHDRAALAVELVDRRALGLDKVREFLLEEPKVLVVDLLVSARACTRRRSEPTSNGERENHSSDVLVLVFDVAPFRVQGVEERFGVFSVASEVSNQAPRS